MDKIVREVEDNDAAADEVYLAASKRMMEMFLPLHRSSGGTQGFVTIQDDPRRDDDPDAIVNAALRGQALGPRSRLSSPVCRRLKNC